MPNLNKAQTDALRDELATTFTTTFALCDEQYSAEASEELDITFFGSHNFNGDINEDLTFRQEGDTVVLTLTNIHPAFPEPDEVEQYWDSNPPLQKHITREQFITVMADPDTDEDRWVDNLFTSEFSAIHIFMGRPEDELSADARESLSWVDDEAEPVVFHTTDGDIQVFIGVSSD